MLPTVLKEKPNLALSHGSRAQLITAKILGIQSVLIFDYEYTRDIPFTNPTWIIEPEIVPDSVTKNKKVRFF